MTVWTELRRDHRQRVLLTGEIVDACNGRTADCTIRNWSPRGARIKVNPEGVSIQPILIAVRDGMAHEARIVWQTECEAGLTFISSVDISRDAPPHLRLARQIWLELARR